MRVLQATLAQLDGRFTLPVAAPADALPPAASKRGGLHVGVQPTLSGALPGMRRYFETYPFSCLEQKTSKAVGLRDATLWAAVANALPTYLDSDGLANYFPPRAEDGPRGSDRLTAYVLAATHEAGFELPAPARDAMLAGLAAFVEGRIERKFWSPRPDLDVRKLAAIEALSRYGRAQPKMLGSVNLTPNLWPTAAVIDWLNILRRVERHSRAGQAPRRGAADPAQPPDLRRHHAEVQHRGRRLLVVADGQRRRQRGAPDPRRARRPGLEGRPAAHGGRQPRRASAAAPGSTTTANLWGSLALDKFSAKFESVKVAGTHRVRIDGRRDRSAHRLGAQRRAAACCSCRGPTGRAR